MRGAYAPRKDEVRPGARKERGGRDGKVWNLPRHEKKAGRRRGKKVESAPAREESGAREKKMNKLRPVGHPYGIGQNART